MSKNLVFVYGSLKRGQSNNWLLEDCKWIGDAAIHCGFNLVDLGPFPALVRSSKNMTIWGEVWELPDRITLHYLDRLEGEGRLYKRILLTVRLENGEVIETWTYLFLQDVRDAPICAEGRWPREPSNANQ